MRQFELWVELEDRCRFSGETLFLRGDGVPLPEHVLAHIRVERPLTPRSSDPGISEDVRRTGWATVRFSS